MGRIELYLLIGVFQGDIIRDLTVGVLLVEIGNPIVFVVLSDDCQQPCGQLIGKDVVNGGSALLAVFGPSAARTWEIRGIIRRRE
jgi:hypothetical protein